jgi:hypothetical protein
MSQLRKVQLATVLTWFLVVGVYGWLYVTSQLALSDLEGYETWWTAQAWFFLLTRVPLAVVVLAILLAVERRLVSAPCLALLAAEKCQTRCTEERCRGYAA